MILLQIVIDIRIFRPEKSGLVHGLDEITKGFVDKTALDLHGGGNFTILFIEFFGQDGKFFDLFYTGQGFIDGLDFAFDKFVDLFVLGEILVGGKLNLVVLGELDDIVFIDDNQAGQEFTPVSNDHGIVDIKTGLEFVLDILRGDIFPACRDNDIFFAVRDGQETVLRQWFPRPRSEASHPRWFQRWLAGS